MKQKYFLIYFFAFLLCFDSFSQRDTSKNEMRFDFGLTREKNINIWPLFKYNTNEKASDLQILMPLFRKKRDYIKREKHTRLLPFFWNDSSKNERELKLVSLYYPSLFHYYRNDTSGLKSYKIGELAPKISLLEFSKTEDGLFVDNNLLFFIWYKNDLIKKRSFLVAFPMYWSFASPQRYSKTFFPLYSYGAIKNRTTNYKVITPLYWNFKDSIKTTNLLFPLWYRKKWQNGTNWSTNYVFPLYWSKKTKTHTKRVLFPLYWQFQNPNYKSVTVFPLVSSGKSEDGTKKHLTITPFYWHTKKDSSTSNFLFPIWYNKQFRSGNYRASRNVIFPLYWSYKDDNEANHVLFPFLWSYKNPKYKSFSFIPLFSKGSSADGQQKHLAVTPLYWHKKSGDDYYNHLFPLWFNSIKGTGDERRVRNVVLPLFYSYKSKEKDKKILFPFLWANKTPTYKSFTFFPLLSTGQSPDGYRKHFMLTPLGWHFKQGQQTRNYLLPLWWHKVDRSSPTPKVSNTIFPLIWYRSDSLRSTKIVAPLLWSFKNPIAESFTFIPFFSKGYNNIDSSRYTAITPIFWQYKTPTIKTDVLFPIWYKTDKNLNGNIIKNRTLFPLYWSRKDTAKDIKVLFPLVWSIDKPNYRFFSAFPLYTKGMTKDSLRSFYSIGNIYWRFKYKDITSNLFFPLWYDRSRKEGYNHFRFQTLFPVYWSFSNAEKNNKVVFPLLWSLDKPRYKSFTFIPFFSVGNNPDHTKKHLTVTPLFWHRKKYNKTKNTLFPIWYYRKKMIDSTVHKSNVIFPLYWSKQNPHKNNKVLFPLVWSFKNKYYESFTLFPVFSKGLSPDSSFKHFAFTPLYWQIHNGKRTTKLLFPLWYNKHSYEPGNEFKRNVIFPMYWSYKDSIKERKVLFPLLWQSKNPRYKHFTFAPFFSTGSTTDGLKKYMAVTPLIWHFKRGEDRTNLILPIWYNKKDVRGNGTYQFKTLFPIYWSTINPEKKSHVVFPLIWYKKTQHYQSFSFLPVMWFGSTTDKQLKRMMITPLFWHSKNKDKKTSVFFPLYWSHKDSIKNRKILLPFVWSMKNERYSSFTFFPLFSKGQSNTNENKHLAVTPLYWHIKKKNKTKNLLLPIWFNQKRITSDDTIKTNVGFPLYWSFSKKNKKTNVLFPLLWSFNNPYYKSFTLFPLLYSGKSMDKKRKHFMFTPLYWNFREEDQLNTGLFPLYQYKREDEKNSKFNIGTILYRQETKNGIKSADFLWPICHFGKDSASTKFRFAPLVWYKKSPKINYFSIQPFFYKQTTLEKKSFNLFWLLYARHKYNDGKTSNNIFWKALYWDKYPNDDFEFRFLYMFVSNVKLEGSIERSFFPFYHYTSEQNGEKSLSLFFHFYNSFKKKLPGLDEFYREERIFWFIRLRSNYKRLVEEGKMQPK